MRAPSLISEGVLPVFERINLENAAGDEYPSE
jgi:hypothetical protein